RLLEHPGPLRSQLLPRIGGMRYVLYGVAVSGRVCSAEIERAEVDRVVRRAIDPMKSDAHEALPLDVLASHVKLDGTITELHPTQVGDSVTGLFVEMHAFPGPIADARDAAVEDLQVLRRQGSLLSGGAGGGKQEDKTEPVHCVPSFPFEP